MTPYYDADGITIYHADCREVDAWLSADVLVTDPPYGVSFVSGRSRLQRPIAEDESTEARDDVLRLWGSKPAMVFGHWSVEPPQATRLCLVWDKGVQGMGDLAMPWGVSHEEIYVLGSGWRSERRAGSVIRLQRLIGHTEHPTEKPVALLRHLIGFAPDGVIADPFMGSGSTLRAAKDLGLRAIGVEIEERYCELAVQRLAQGVLAL